MLKRRRPPSPCNEVNQSGEPPLDKTITDAVNKVAKAENDVLLKESKEESRKTLRELLKFKKRAEESLRVGKRGHPSKPPEMEGVNLYRLGSGTFGDVWGAEDIGMCVKVYKHKGTVESLPSYIADAFEAITNSKPANFVPILGALLSSKVIVAVMPTYQTDLYTVIRNKEKAIQSMLWGVNNGLAELRSMGWEFVDLKPANVLYDRKTGQAVIGDADGIRPIGWKVTWGDTTFQYRSLESFMWDLSERHEHPVIRHKPPLGLFGLAMIAIELALGDQPAVKTPVCFRNLDGFTRNILMLWVLCSMMGSEMTQKILARYAPASQEGAIPPLTAQQMVAECYRHLYFVVPEQLRTAGHSTDALELKQFMDGGLTTFKNLVDSVKKSTQFPCSKTKRYYVETIVQILYKDVTDPREVLDYATSATTTSPVEKDSESNPSIPLSTLMYS